MQMKPMELTMKYPEVGVTVKCIVTRSTFTQAILKIIEIDGYKTEVDYKAILKGNAIGEEIYVCDSVKMGDILDCVVISIGDTAIFVSKV